MPQLTIDDRELTPYGACAVAIVDSPYETIDDKELIPVAVAPPRDDNPYEIIEDRELIPGIVRLLRPLPLPLIELTSIEVIRVFPLISRAYQQVAGLPIPKLSVIYTLVVVNDIVLTCGVINPISTIPGLFISPKRILCVEIVEKSANWLLIYLVNRLLVVNVCPIIEEKLDMLQETIEDSEDTPVCGCAAIVERP